MEATNSISNSPGPIQPPGSTTLRKFAADERCRFKSLNGAGRRVVVRLTYRCDLACPHCLVGNDLYSRSGELSFPEWAKILAGLSAIGTRKVLLTGGEPLLHQDLTAIVAFISQMGIPVDLNSNLQQLSPGLIKKLQRAGLTEISVSLEGPEQVHDRMHGRQGAFKKTVEGIRRATELGITVDGSCCLTQHNYRFIDKLLDSVEGLGLQSFTISRMFPIGHGASHNQDGLSQEQLTETYNYLYAQKIPTSRIPIRLVGLLHFPGPEDCGRVRSLIGLTPSGEVLPCVLMAEHPVGIPHPLEVGLAVSVARLDQALQEKEYRLCCDPLTPLVKR